MARVARKASAEEPELHLPGLWEALRHKVNRVKDPRLILSARCETPADAEKILSAAPLAHPGLAAAMKRRQPVEVSPSMIPAPFADTLNHWVFRRAAEFEPQRLVRDGVRLWRVTPDDMVCPASRFAR